MPLVFRYEATNNVNVDQGSAGLRFGTISLTQSAKVGEPAMNELVVDDEDGTRNFVGYRTFVVEETSAPSNSQVLVRGRIIGQRVGRGPSMRTTTARRWTLEFADQNVLLGWRIIRDADAKRPAETAGDRIRWLVNSSSSLVVAHPTYFANPSTAMDANDYRNMRFADVLGDIANVTGYNYWCDWDEGRERPELYFIDPNGADYTSTLSISNDLADIDSTTVFAPSEDAELFRDPSRITAFVAVAYENGTVYANSSTTGGEFAFVDQVAPVATIKTEAKARALALRYLADNDEQDEKIICSVIVPAASVNLIKHGMLIPVKFTHFPGYTAPTSMRITQRTVIQDENIGQDNYLMRLELSATGLPAGCSSLGTATPLTGTYSYSHTLSMGVNPANPNTALPVQPGGGSPWVQIGGSGYPSPGSATWYAVDVDRGASPSPASIGSIRWEYSLDAGIFDGSSVYGPSLWASNDGSAWTQVATIAECWAATVSGTITISIPADWRTARYFRFRTDDYFASGYWTGTRILNVYCRECVA